MKIVIDNRIVETNGTIKIDQQIVQEAGYKAGDKIEVYCVNGMDSNTLIISPVGEEGDEQNAEIAEIELPNILMEKAGILEDADIEVVCEKGIIVIAEKQILDSLYGGSDVDF